MRTIARSPRIGARLAALVLVFLFWVASLGAAQPQPDGFITVRQVDGVWWFIDPDGNPFVSIGVNHVEPHLWLGDYNREHTLRKYGRDLVDAGGKFDPDSESARRWAHGVVELAREYGFNTFGKHTHPDIPRALFQDRIYYVESLETAPVAAWKVTRNRGWFPDVFSGDFVRHLETHLAAVCARHRDQRYLLGYSFTDLPYFEIFRAERHPDEVSKGLIYPWASALVALNGLAPGKLRWIELLRERYADVTAVRQVYEVPGDSWPALADVTHWTDVRDPKRAQADHRAFAILIAEEWYRLHHDTLRRHDPHHLILGDKHMHMPDWLPAILAKYVDVNLIQNPAPFGVWQAETVRRLYEITGKPVMNGDGPSFSVRHPEHQSKGLKGFKVPSEAEAARLWREYVRDAMAVPYFVGFHTCGFLVQWDDSERGDIDANENGFLDPFEQPRPEMAAALKEITGRATELHRQATP